MNQNHGKLIINLDSTNQNVVQAIHFQTTNKNQKMRRNKALMKRNKIHSNHTWKGFKYPLSSSKASKISWITLFPLLVYLLPLSLLELVLLSITTYQQNPKSFSLILMIARNPTLFTLLTFQAFLSEPSACSLCLS